MGRGAVITADMTAEEIRRVTEASKGLEKKAFFDRFLEKKVVLKEISRYFMGFHGV